MWLKWTSNIMEVGNLKPPDDQTPIAKTVKRPFDVAFLMLPDERLKEKQAKENEERDSPVQKLQNQVKYFQNIPQRQQIFDDPRKHEQKSAFTKVNIKESRLSPNLSVSPDLSYQSSLSPSPPIRSYPTFQHAHFKTHIPYQGSFVVPESFAPQENPFLAQKTFDPNFAKMRPIATQYRPEFPQFPGEMLKMAPEIRHPAAAILSTLLPPSLAALSLPAQNICAKCNISFRMTSDLVYHMRSHHKSDSVDFTKRRREDKLKCPVCQESFRERHHLTRHMTAHQDKEDDLAPSDRKKKNFANFPK